MHFCRAPSVGHPRTASLFGGQYKELKCSLLKAPLGARSSNSAHCKGNFEPFYVDELEAPVSLLKAALGAHFQCCRMGAQMHPAKGNFEAQISIIAHRKRQFEHFDVESLQPKFVLLESSATMTVAAEPFNALCS